MCLAYAENTMFHLLRWVIADQLYKGNSRINNTKAIENGLTFRPLSKTIKDTLYWWKSGAVTQARRDELMTNENSIFVKDKAVINAWQNK